MKFPVKICMGCGLDLTTAKPANVKGPGKAPLVGICPQCSAPYFMVEDSTPLSDVPEPEPEPEPEAEVEAEVEAEPVTEPEPEAEVEPESPETPEAEPEP